MVRALRTRVRMNGANRIRFWISAICGEAAKSCVPANFAAACLATARSTGATMCQARLYSKGGKIGATQIR